MFLRDLTKPVSLKPCDPSRHNTLRHDQAERRRKIRRRAAAKLPRYRYRRKPPAMCERCNAKPRPYRADYCAECDAALDDGPFNRMLQAAKSAR